MIGLITTADLTAAVALIGIVTSVAAFIAGVCIGRRL